MRKATNESGPPPAKHAIGVLSRLSGCPVETIRYYERIGLLAPPPRTEGGHRAYDDAAVSRLSFIRRSRALGFTLQDIGALLRRVDGGAYTCAEVRDIALDHLADVRAKIADLKAMERSLKTLADTCAGGDVTQCRIIDALSEIPRSGTP
ncbi:MerR family transcriptional regulator [Varunaivibrio sulfuroxidans]|uniref:Cu(I)-responsive transcriptional regulator n=1 Tax=Varunaivibrio sulfuroxidans TaxID=1773489 RepID=A0A4R3JJM0_9PROT|nr:helix-turn-helix domain-containing protein [Varunaivibrio sulfuroxidans]TCS65080.1 Cu(I)-responsive transcriptional regulator [Varunaivibrio sulfuroxidans]WES29633.1 helix-turn-helix domain-containing protein [Varunaivibrio sulfuroxidans]